MTLKQYQEREWCARHDECVASYYFWTYDYYFECSETSQEHLDKRQEQACKRHPNLHASILMGLEEIEI